ncbi:MAG: ATP-binding protein [Rhodopila sp.]
MTIKTANIGYDGSDGEHHDLQPDQYVVLSVTDTGAGMPEEVRARAFDPFYTTKPSGKGTGLGLSMVYGFAKQTGGSAEIDSDPGIGTTVRIYLPRYQGSEASDGIAAPASAAPTARAGKTVLVVDDEPTVRLLVTDVLTEFGYETIEAPDGAAGLDVLQSDAEIDLLITDVRLPGSMNGPEMVEASRSVRPGLKVLFITGYAFNAASGGGYLQQGRNVLTKPFTMDRLAGSVKRIMDG